MTESRKIESTVPRVGLSAAIRPRVAVWVIWAAVARRRGQAVRPRVVVRIHPRQIVDIAHAIVTLARHIRGSLNQLPRFKNRAIYLIST